MTDRALSKAGGKKGRKHANILQHCCITAVPIIEAVARTDDDNEEVKEDPPLPQPVPPIQFAKFGGLNSLHGANR